MPHLQKAGAIAALFEAFAYIIGFAAMATFLDPGDTAGWSPVQKLSFLLAHKTLFQAWHGLVYVAFALALVVLAVALHERLKPAGGAWVAIATPFALIWSGLVLAAGMVANVGIDAVAQMYARDATQAATVWAAIASVQEAIGGGVEIVGGVWVLLITVAGMRARYWSKALAGLGVVVGLAGVLTVVPAWGDLAAVFGLTQIVWFVWIGAVLLRPAKPPLSLQ